MAVSLKIQSDYSDKGTKRAKSSLSGLERHGISAFKKMAAAFVGIFAFSKIKNFVTGSIAAFGAQEKASKELALALETSGVSADEFLPKLSKVASALQVITRVDDDAVISIMALGSSMGITADNLDEAATAAVAFNKKFGIDLKTGMRGVALAFQGNTQQLGRYIPALRGIKDAGEAYNVILGMTNNLLKEQSGLQGTNLERVAAVKAAWSDLTERFGEFFIKSGGITDILDEVLFALEDIQASGFKKWIEDTFPTLAKWAEMLGIVAAGIEDINTPKTRAQKANDIFGTSRAGGMTEADVFSARGGGNPAQAAAAADKQLRREEQRARREERMAKALADLTALQSGMGTANTSITPATAASSRSLSIGDLFEMVSGPKSKPGESPANPIYTQEVDPEAVGGLAE
jgi:hypothetical protein